MTYKYNPFWQQRIRETVRHALNVHPRLTALRVDLRFPDVPGRLLPACRLTVRNIYYVRKILSRS